MNNGFARLMLGGWRQFDDIDLDLSRRLTIVTGANGAGKTTILNLLIQHFGWASQFVARAQFHTLTSG
jgi:predicted ATPase